MLRARIAVLLSALVNACTVGVETEPFDDIEAGVVVLEGSELTDELTASPVREAPPFVRLGFLYDADRANDLGIAYSTNGHDWSPWLVPTLHHTEVEGVSNFVAQLELPPGVTGNYYRLHSPDPSAVNFVRMELMDHRASEHVESGTDDPQTQTVARMVGGMTVHTRSDWGARAANCSSSLGTVTRMAIHHTETPTNDSMSPQARLRQIQSYHMDVKGWCDIGYHYLVSRDGRIWDGRPDTKLGAHAGGANTGNIGISVMGSHDATPITQTQLDAIAGLVRALAQTHGVAIDRTKIKGHREHTSTSCPGNALFNQLGAIVSAANSGSSGGGGGGGGGGGMSTSCDLATDAPWHCAGLAGTTTNPADTYYTTSFGCWVDANGVHRGDPGDNCIPACSLPSIGCSGLTGPQCERMYNWYTAGSDRFGCGTKVKVTNPSNGKSAILISIDRGPNCSIENIVDFWVLDMSYPASNYLFGGPTSAAERADVQVEVVDDSLPVGPHEGSATCAGDGTGTGGMPGTVTVMGVLYVGANTADRIAGATVTLGGQTTTTSSVGAWEFHDVPSGSFTVTASKPGYMPRSLTRMTDSAQTWASFGLSVASMSSGSAILQGVVYHGTSSANRIPNASISFSTGSSTTADGNGYYKVTNLPAGPITITASAPGYAPASVQRTLVDGVTEWGSIKLQP